MHVHTHTHTSFWKLRGNISVPLTSIQHHGVHSNFLSFPTYNCLLRRWKPHCPLHICLFAQSLCMYPVLNEAISTWCPVISLGLQTPWGGLLLLLPVSMTSLPCLNSDNLFRVTLLCKCPSHPLSLLHPPALWATESPSLHPLLCLSNSSRTGLKCPGKKKKGIGRTIPGFYELEHKPFLSLKD